jgi:tetratricopeptide (TPR) repeat protein
MYLRWRDNSRRDGPKFGSAEPTEQAPGAQEQSGSNTDSIRDIAICSEGSWHEALAACSRLIGRGKMRGADLASIYFRRAKIYFSKGDDDNAIKDFTNVIRLNPSSVAAFNERGLSFAGNGEHDRAIDDYTEAIRLNGASYLPYSYRGSAFENKGELDKALADFRAALSNGSTTASADINRVERTLQALRDQRISERPIYCGDPRMCSDPKTAKAWLNFTAAYYALYFSDSTSREVFESGEQQWRAWLAFQCALSFDQDASFSPQQRACVVAEYSNERPNIDLA